MDLDPKLLNLIPERYVLYILIAHEATRIIGHAYAALRDNGGIKMILANIYCGKGAAVAEKPQTRENNETKPNQTPNL